jgi:hypothetical protein
MPGSSPGAIHRDVTLQCENHLWFGVVLFEEDTIMLGYDALGFLAAGLVFGTFYMKSMVPLRFLALCSNVAFIGYAAGLGLTPVLVLHAALLPVNAWRLWQARNECAALWPMRSALAAVPQPITDERPR